MTPSFPCEIMCIITLCIEFIEVLKWINNCELLRALKVIPRHQAPNSKRYFKTILLLINKKQIFCSMYKINFQLRLLWLKKKKSQLILLPYFNLFIVSVRYGKLFRVRKKIEFQIVGERKKNFWSMTTLSMWLHTYLWYVLNLSNCWNDLKYVSS